MYTITVTCVVPDTDELSSFLRQIQDKDVFFGADTVIKTIYTTATPEEESLANENTEWQEKTPCMLCGKMLEEDDIEWSEGTESDHAEPFCDICIDIKE